MRARYTLIHRLIMSDTAIKMMGIIWPSQVNSVTSQVPSSGPDSVSLLALFAVSLSLQPPILSSVATSSSESAAPRLSRSWRMCSGSVVPVSGCIPSCAAKRKTT